MSTIEQHEAPGHGFRESSRGVSGARTDTADVALLLVTILVLIGIAAGIAIAFPLALEVFAAQSNAATVVSSAPRPRIQEEEKIEGEDEPLIIDDVRSGKLMYAATGNTAPLDRSIPQPSTTYP